MRGWGNFSKHSGVGSLCGYRLQDKLSPFAPLAPQLHIQTCGRLSPSQEVVTTHCSVVPPSFLSMLGQGLPRFPGLLGARCVASAPRKVRAGRAQGGCSPVSFRICCTTWQHISHHFVQGQKAALSCCGHSRCELENPGGN